MTFKREEVEFITPLHPLVEALRLEARRRFLQVYIDSRGLAPRRLAARRVPARQPAGIVFTFLAAVGGGGDLIEEHLIAVRVNLDGAVVGDPIRNLRLLECEVPGEVPPERVLRIFGAVFDEARKTASVAAEAWVQQRAALLRDHRGSQAGLLRSELATDLADRLREIGREESRARAVADAAGQQLLFESGDPRGTSFAVRRKAAQAQAEERAREIIDYETVDAPAEPRALGALFLVPDAAP
jgi:hypothetical protein